MTKMIVAFSAAFSTYCLINMAVALRIYRSEKQGLVSHYRGLTMVAAAVFAGVFLGDVIFGGTPERMSIFMGLFCGSLMSLYTAMGAG